jgi:gas vesicle protein
MTLATKLRGNKAVYAGAGAVDLAVEKLREVPVHVTRLQGTAKVNASRLQETAKENASKLQETAKENATRLQQNAKEFQGRVDTKDLPGAAVAYMTHLGTRVAEVIDELAERGKTVVNRVEADVPEISEPKPTPRAKAATAKKTAQTAAKKAGN